VLCCVVLCCVVLLCCAVLCALTDAENCRSSSSDDDDSDEVVEPSGSPASSEDEEEQREITPSSRSSPPTKHGFTQVQHTAFVNLLLCYGLNRDTWLSYAAKTPLLRKKTYEQLCAYGDFILYQLMPNVTPDLCMLVDLLPESVRALRLEH
jgi:hypothetical protein